MIRAWYLALKDLKLLLRDPAALFWAFGFPVLFALFFGFAFSGSGQKMTGLKVAVVDEDGSALSRRFAARIGTGESVTTFSASRAGALQQLRRGQAAGAVLIGPSFEETLTGLLPRSRALFTTPPLELAVDPGRRMEAGYLHGVLLRARFEAVADEVLRPERVREFLDRARSEVTQEATLSADARSHYLQMIASAETLLKQGDLSTTATSGSALGELFQIPEAKGKRSDENRPHSYFQVAFPQAIIWGLLGCVSAFAVSLVQERSRGTFQRLRISPISRGQILAGKGLACFVTAIAVVVVLVVLGALVFQTRLHSLPLLAVTAVCLALCFVGIMMFASTLGRTEQGVSGAGWAVFIVMSMFGGGMLPLFIMPPWMQSLSNFSPVKWGILALEGLYWRNFSAAEMLTPWLVLLGCGALFFLLGLTLMRRLDSPGR